jgi:hypothetical protein
MGVSLLATDGPIVHFNKTHTGFSFQDTTYTSHEGFFWTILHYTIGRIWERFRTEIVLVQEVTASSSLKKRNVFMKPSEANALRRALDCFYGHPQHYLLRSYQEGIERDLEAIQHNLLTASRENSKRDVCVLTYFFNLANNKIVAADNIVPPHSKVKEWKDRYKELHNKWELKRTQIQEATTAD